MWTFVFFGCLGLGGSFQCTNNYLNLPYMGYCPLRPNLHEHQLWITFAIHKCGGVCIREEVDISVLLRIIGCHQEPCGSMALSSSCRGKKLGSNPSPPTPKKNSLTCCKQKKKKKKISGCLFEYFVHNCRHYPGDQLQEHGI